MRWPVGRPPEPVRSHSGHRRAAEALGVGVEQSADLCDEVLVRVDALQRGRHESYVCSGQHGSPIPAAPRGETTCCRRHFHRPGGQGAKRACLPGRLPSGRATTTRGYDDGRTRNRGGGDLDGSGAGAGGCGSDEDRPVRSDDPSRCRDVQRVHHRGPDGGTDRDRDPDRGSGADGRAGVGTASWRSAASGSTPRRGGSRPSTSVVVDTALGRVDHRKSGGLMLSVAPLGVARS